MKLERGYIALNEDAESRNVGRIADTTTERLVVGRNGGDKKEKNAGKGEESEGEREKWRPRAEITFVFLI